MPTGNVPVTKIQTGSTKRILAQAATIVFAALSVGLLVFFVIQALAGSDPADEPEDVIEQDLSIIDPGPGGEDLAEQIESSRSGSRRSAADGADPTAESAATPAAVTDPDATKVDPAGPAQQNQQGDGLETSSLTGDADQADAATATTAQSIVTGPGDLTSPTTNAPINGGPNNNPPSSGAPLVTAPATSTPAISSPTTSGSTPTTATTPTPSTTGGAPATTQATTSTTAAPTTTTTRPTTTPPTSNAPPAPLIADPTSGQSRPWDTPTRFRANPQPGASKYCWTFAGRRAPIVECITGLVYELPARPRGIAPGPVKIKAQAFAPDGSLITEANTLISLLHSQLADRPADGAIIDPGQEVRLEARNLRRNGRYCWTFFQGSDQTAEVCGKGHRVRLRPNSPQLANLRTGPARVRISAYRDQDLIGRQVINVTVR